MQFVVTAYDGTDPEALGRRLAVRAAHLEGIDVLRKAGNLIAGGAILNEKDEMIGSTLYVEFESRAALDEWLNQDPYTTGGVWKDVRVERMRLAATRSP